MKEGQRCFLMCSEGNSNVGYFTCSLGELVGKPSCPPKSESRTVEVVTKLASTIEVEIDVSSGVGIEQVSKITKKSIATALQVSIEQITSFEVREIGGSSGRRLRSLQIMQTRRFEISYEIVLASSKDVDALLVIANAMTTPSTATFQVIWQFLSTQFPRVHKVLLKIPVRKFEDEIAIANQALIVGHVTPVSSGMTPVTVSIWACVTFMCVVPVVMVVLRILFLMRKRLTES